jgi:hypothetical protein
MIAEEKIFRWGYRLLLALAVRSLHDAHNDKGIWPGKMERGEFSGKFSGSILRTRT